MSANIWWEVRCDRHGKTEAKRPPAERVLTVGEPNGKDPKHVGICPLCAIERKAALRANVLGTSK